MNATALTPAVPTPYTGVPATLTVKDIATALGVSRQRAAERAAGDPKWIFQEVTGRGGKKRLYPFATLPKPIQLDIVHYYATLNGSSDATATTTATPTTALATALAPSPAKYIARPIDPARVAPEHLNDAQRVKRDARQRLLDFIGTYPSGVKAAIAYLNAAAREGLLTPVMKWGYENCHDKTRPGQAMACKTYYNWLAEQKARGSLAPAKKEKDFAVKPWHSDAVLLRQRPQGSTVAWVHTQLRALGHDVSYHQVARFFRDQFSSIDQLKGRFSGSQLRSQRFYQHRTSEGLAPADEVHADGWNTHFTAPHPVTGEYVTHEVWHYHDVATRYVTPPGIGLSEQFEVIAKGLENFIRVFGRLLILQTDSTKIIKGSARFTKGLHSLEERIGCTITHPQEVGNSQANGICENFNTSWLDKRSRELATYQNPTQMDELTFKRVKKLTAAMVKAEKAGDLTLRAAKKKEAERMGKGLVFDTYQDAVDWINRTIAEYNDRPHSSLKKITDPESGARRHQSPREALIEHICNGWEPVEVDSYTLIEMFRPVTRCRVTRETVTPYGGMRYQNPEVLGHWNGKTVTVYYDIHDYQTVWVKDDQGELICEAQFVSATGYRPQTAYDAAEAKRGRAQLAAAERKKQRILERRPMAALEQDTGNVIEGISSVVNEYSLQDEMRSVVQPLRRQREELIDLDMYDLSAVERQGQRPQEQSVAEMMAAAVVAAAEGTPAKDAAEPVYADMLMWMAGLAGNPAEREESAESAVKANGSAVD